MVYIVDDAIDARVLVHDVLFRASIPARGAASAQEALEEIQRMPPRLILLDVTLPGSGSDDFLRKKRGLPVLASIPVLLLGSVGTSDEFAGPDVVGVVTKPIDVQKFLESVRHALIGPTIATGGGSGVETM